LVVKIPALLLLQWNFVPNHSNQTVMNEKFLKLIDKRIDRLEDKDFDLEAWKESTITSMTRFLGEGDPAIKQIENLKIDYSSWALRDATSTYNPLETCKKKGKEVLLAVKDELEAEEEVAITAVDDILKQHLSESTYKTLSKIDSADEIYELLKKQKKDLLAKIIKDIITV
jgi:hypothetical protein